MSSLTETAYYTRRTVNWLILGLMAYFILRIFWSISVVTFRVLFPPKPKPPNHRFGPLPPLVFPQNPAPAGFEKIEYRLDTISGAVPVASKSAAVYFMPKNPKNLLALPKTQEFAKNFQFDPTPDQETKEIYRFKDPSSPLRRLRYDIVNNNFVLRYIFEEDLGLFSEKNFTSAEALVSQSQDVMETYDLYKADIAGGITRITYLQLDGKSLVQTTSLSKADAVRIDFMRRAIGSMPVVNPNPDDAPISIIFSGSRDSRKRILQFAYTYWPVDYSAEATYALKESAQAWADLQNGGGYIARYPQKNPIAVVRNVYLAFYDSYDPQTYLQPVFVFEGDEGFVGYVPAVANEWVSTE